MMNRFVNPRKTWVLSSLFALMMAASNLMGAETENSTIKPEIRSSKAPIVQIANTAASRLQQQVEQDGGSLEEDTPTVGEKANAAIQDAADVVYSAGNTTREFLAEQGREYLGRPGEATGQLIGGLAQGVTAVGGGLTQVSGYVTEGVTDASVWTYDNALKPAATKIADGAETVWNWSGEQLTNAGSFFTGLFTPKTETPLVFHALSSAPLDASGFLSLTPSS